MSVCMLKLMRGGRGPGKGSAGRVHVQRRMAQLPQILVGGVGVGLVRQPTAEPCQTTGTQAALCQVIHSVAVLGLFSNHNCAPSCRVARRPVVALRSSRGRSGLAGIVSPRHGLTVVVAPGSRGLGRRVVASRRHKPRLTRRHVRRPLLHVALSRWIEDGGLWLLWRLWLLRRCLRLRYPPRLRVAVAAGVWVVGGRRIVGHLGKRGLRGRVWALLGIGDLGRGHLLGIRSLQVSA